MKKYIVTMAIVALTLVGVAAGATNAKVVHSACFGVQGGTGVSKDDVNTKAKHHRFCIVGKTGAAGQAGTNGTNGTNGANGATGSQGPQGVAGPKGDTGAQGMNGQDGQSVTISALPNAILCGIPGGVWLRAANGNAAVCNGAKGVKGDTGTAGSNGTNGTNGQDGATGPQGPKGDTGATGPQGPAGPAQLESWSNCTATLCLDSPPQGPNGLDGSGGWGWDNGANAPVSTLTVGQDAGFTVTVMEPNPDSSPASITLTYSSQDLSLNGTASDGTVGTNPFGRGGVETFDYPGGFHNNDKSVGFTFTPQNDTAEALVTATVQVDGQTASETFPVAISG